MSPPDERHRRYNAKNPTLAFRLPPDKMVALDRLRGSLTRSEYIKALIELDDHLDQVREQYRKERFKIMLDSEAEAYKREMMAERYQRFIGRKV